MALATLDPVLFLDQTAGDQQDESPFDNTLLTTWGFSDKPSDYAIKTFSLITDGISFSLKDDDVTNTGLTALDGTEILLSAAKTAANGATYFEAYLEGTNTVAFRLVYEPIVNGDGLNTGYTLHALLYNDDVQIRHSNPDDPDDLASMHALVEVVAQSDFQFVFTDFSGIPSGQQAFGVLKEPSLTPDPTPDTSNDVVITSKVFDKGQWLDSTINTSNVAGAASAIGVGSQSVNTNEVVIYDFVTDANFTDSKNLATLVTGGPVAVSRAFSTVTQLNPNNANTRADVKVWLRDGDPGDAIFDGNDNVGVKTVYLYLGGNYEDPAYTISSADGPTWIGPTGSGLSVTFTNGEYAEIKGLKTGDRFEVEGDGQFNRLVVGNDGTGNRSFDLGVTGYSIFNSEFEGTLLGGIGIYDDGPTVTAIGVGETTLTLDESPLPDAGDGLWSDSVTFGTTDYFNTPDYGADGPGGEPSYTLELSASELGSGLFALDPNNDTNGKGNEILLSNSGGTIEGKVGDTVYFTIAVDSATGEVTFTRERNIWHGIAGNTPAAHDDAASLVVSGDGFLRLVKTVVDGDGDTAAAYLQLGNGVFLIEDDGPAFLLPLGATAVKLDSAIGTGATQTEEVLNWDSGTDGFRKIELANFLGNADPGNGSFSHEVTASSAASISIDISYGGQKIATHVFNADAADSFTTHAFEGEVVIEQTLLEDGAAVKAGGPHPLEFRNFPNQELSIMVTGGTRTEDQNISDPYMPGVLNTSSQGYAAGNTNQNLDPFEAIEFTFTEFIEGYDYDQAAADASTAFKNPGYLNPVPGEDGLGDYLPVGGFGFELTKLNVAGSNKVADFQVEATFATEGGNYEKFYYQFSDVSTAKIPTKVFVGFDPIIGWDAFAWDDTNGNGFLDNDENLIGKVESGSLPDKITGLVGVQVFNNDVDGRADTFNVTNPSFYSLGSRTQNVPEFNYSFDLNLYDTDFDFTTVGISAKIEGNNQTTLNEQLLLGQTSLA